MEYLLIGAGGMLGAIARYGVGKWVGSRSARSFPLATFFINISGSFGLGLLYIMFSTASGFFGDILRPFVTIGFLGAFTTFSTFSLEIITLLEEGQVSTAAAYFLASLTGGLAAAFLGIVIGQMIM